MPARYFVALNVEGQPVAQRSTLRTRSYLSASYDGSSFSSRPPDGAYPLKVVEVPKMLEWVVRATLEDGTKIILRSSSRAYHAGLYVRYRYKCGNTWETSEACTCLTEAAWRAQHPRDEVVAVAPSTVELRNWPAPVDLGPDPMGDHHGRNE
jgi:hypothetical protein